MAASLLSLAAAGSMVVGPARPAFAYTVGPPSEGLECSAASVAALAVLEAHLSPANGTSVQAGSPVSFSGEASAPVTFSIASSPRLLSSPDVDTGLGTAGTQPDSSGPPPFYTYTFTSTMAAAKARTVYWQASFSNATLPACAGATPSVFTTLPRILTVGPAPSPAPAPQPEATPSTPAAPVAAPAPLQVTVNAKRSFNPAHPVIAYRVHCSAGCTGRTSAEVLVLRRNAKPQRFAKLGLGPRSLSIASADGGSQRFARHYSGASSRLLERLLQAGSTVELQIHVSATGTVAEQAQSPRPTTRVTTIRLTET